VVVVEDFKAFSDATTMSERCVAYFTASWCPPCRTISPVFATLSSKHADVKFLKVDVSRAREGGRARGGKENGKRPKQVGSHWYLWGGTCSFD
jgi:thiol-disulfide isomerase/thioredoxin